MAIKELTIIHLDTQVKNVETFINLIQTLSK